MRKISPLVLAFVTLFGATGLHAGPMNKCVIKGSVSYQQAPCSSTQARKDPTLDELNAAENKRRATSNTTQFSPVASTSSRGFQPPASTAAGNYRCDGRKHCSQMSSCAEAKFFLNNCPGVKMDGDNDGIPCEDQWCSP